GPSPSPVTTSPTWPPASRHETTGGAAACAAAAAAASATRERSARARFTGAARAPGCRRGSLAFASAHAAVAPAPAGRPLASLAHGERPAPELRAVEGADRRLGLGIGGELDEGEAARPPGLPV